ncbi:MAG: hypothetical protein OEV42_10140 [Deltaproteobacteria bacterium]|nr:hypothetical protein [Deltaproteobacteria bacterium]
MKAKFLYLLLIFVICSYSPEAFSLSFSGHYRNFLVYSKTRLENKEYYLDNNRLRIEAKGGPWESFSYNIQYDNNVIFGDYLTSREFMAYEAFSAAMPESTRWILDHNIKKEDKLRWNHSIHRAYATLRYKNLDLKLGRQRVSWGKGWFWSPLDMFNPIASTAVEREDRKGVDGALLTLSSGRVASYSLLYLPQREAPESVALRLVRQAGSYDLAFSAGRHMERTFAGIDFAGYIGDGGVYGELVSIEDYRGDQKVNLLLSGNYNFESSLYIMLEYFHNGGWSAPWMGIDYSGEDYAGLQASYDLTPLTKWNNFFIVNLDDRSFFFTPRIVSSLFENIDLSLGVQTFGGNRKGEYGRLENLYYTDLKWFF